MTLKIEDGEIVREVVETEPVDIDELTTIRAQLVRRLAEVDAEIAEHAALSVTLTPEPKTITR